MVLWIVIALLSAAAALAVLWPLSRSHGLPDAGGPADATTVYRAQLSDIERDAGRGLINAHDAESLRIEASRRLLKSAERGRPGNQEASTAQGRHRLAALAILATVPLGALLLYGALGSPQLPGQPLAERAAVAADRLDLGQALQRIEAHLAAEPGDLKGWDVVAPIYLRLERYNDAARAYDTAIRNGGGTAARWAALGEARMLADGGVVSVGARTAFDTALQLEPTLPNAIYGRAMARQQDGDSAGAIHDIERLIMAAPQDAPYLGDMTRLLEEMRVTAQGTTKSEANAIAGLPEADRGIMIRTMVEGLSKRLEATGGTLEEWQRLVRARMVLGEKAAAQSALAMAWQRLGADPAALAALSAIAAELKLDAVP